MPFIVIVTFMIEFACAVHVVRTGRPLYWLFLIFIAPMLGCAVYFFVEMLPDLQHSRAARNAGSNLRRVVDPGRDYREAVRNLEDVDSVENKRALAALCLERGQYDEAVDLLKRCLTGVHHHDPAVMKELAEAYFKRGSYIDVIRTLDELRQHNPDYQSSAAHMLYARALDELGRYGEAESEYEALTEYFSGEEARARLALLLLKSGQPERARTEFEKIVHSVDRANKVYFRAQREWYDLAKQYTA